MRQFSRSLTFFSALHLGDILSHWCVLISTLSSGSIVLWSLFWTPYSHAQPCWPCVSDLHTRALAEKSSAKHLLCPTLPLWWVAQTLSADWQSVSFSFWQSFLIPASHASPPPLIFLESFPGPGLPLSHPLCLLFLVFIEQLLFLTPDQLSLSIFWLFKEL